jgi:nitric oxide synthase oxygenase domain/subunit
MSTYRALLEVQGAMQLMDGRRYTLDDVLKKMAHAVTIEISRAVDRVKDKALRDVEEDHEQE